MLNFVFILAIILEISLTSFFVLKLIEAQKSVEIWNEKVVFAGKIALQVNTSLNKNIKKINKFVSIFTNKKTLLAIKIIKLSFSIFQMFLFFRTFNFSKGFLFNLKSAKKLLYAQFTKELIKNICKYL